MSTPEATSVLIGEIVLRPEWQVRGSVNERVVTEYVTATIHGEMPPVRLANVKGALMLVDGWHRLAAAKRLNRDRISAVVEEMTEEAAQWEAADANTRHGLPLKRTEKREVFRVYVRTGRNMDRRRYKSYRDIAAELHGIVSKSALQRWMEEDFPQVASKMSQGAPGSTESPEPEEHTKYYRDALVHLQQITAVAPALPQAERELIAGQLSEAAARVLTAGAPKPKPKPSDFTL